MRMDTQPAKPRDQAPTGLRLQSHLRAGLVGDCEASCNAEYSERLAWCEAMRWPDNMYCQTYSQAYNHCLDLCYSGPLPEPEQPEPEPEPWF